MNVEKPSCREHPGRSVTASCGRCGAFVCDECARIAAGAFCGSCSARLAATRTSGLSEFADAAIHSAISLFRVNGRLLLVASSIAFAARLAVWLVLAQPGMDRDHTGRPFGFLVVANGFITSVAIAVLGALTGPGRATSNQIRHPVRLVAALSAVHAAAAGLSFWTINRAPYELTNRADAEILMRLALVAACQVAIPFVDVLIVAAASFEASRVVAAFRLLLAKPLRTLTLVATFLAIVLPTSGIGSLAAPALVNEFAFPFRSSLTVGTFVSLAAFAVAALLFSVEVALTLSVWRTLSALTVSAREVGASVST